MLALILINSAINSGIELFYKIIHRLIHVITWCQLNIFKQENVMMILTITSLLISILGILITVGIFLFSTLQLRKGVKTAFQIDVRKRPSTELIETRKDSKKAIKKHIRNCLIFRTSWRQCHESFLPCFLEKYNKLTEYQKLIYLIMRCTKDYLLLHESFKIPYLSMRAVDFLRSPS